MKGLFLNIQLNDENLSGFVESFTFEDSMDKDNILSLTFKEDLTLLLLNNSNLTVGNKLIFNFGFIGKSFSENHEAIISNIDTSYSEDAIVLTVTALDKGHYTKKKTDNKIWLNKTTSQIAAEIATKYDFKTDITETKKVYKNLPQGNLSDFDFLNDLALKETNFLFFVRNNTLFFTERGLTKTSILTLTYGASNLISFKPIEKESNASGVGDETNIQVYDDENKTTEAISVTNNNEQKTVTTTGVYIDSDKGELLKGNKKLIINTDDKEEATNISNNVKKNNILDTFEAELTIEGTPNLRPNQIITIENVARRHTGNWLIKTVRHSITSAGYKSMCNLTARGNSSGNVVADIRNKTIGGSEVDTSKELNVLRIDSDTGKILN